MFYITHVNNATKIFAQNAFMSLKKLINLRLNKAIDMMKIRSRKSSMTPLSKEDLTNCKMIQNTKLRMLLITRMEIRITQDK